MESLSDFTKDTGVFILNEYIKKNAPSYRELNILFQEACKLGNIQVVNFLLSKTEVNPNQGDFNAGLFGLSPNLSKAYGLQQAVCYEQLDVVDILLKDGRCHLSEICSNLMKIAFIQANICKSSGKIAMVIYLHDHFYDNYINWKSNLPEELVTKIDSLYEEEKNISSDIRSGRENSK